MVRIVLLYTIYNTYIQLIYIYIHTHNVHNVLFSMKPTRMKGCLSSAVASSGRETGATRGCVLLRVEIDPQPPRVYLLPFPPFALITQFCAPRAHCSGRKSRPETKRKFYPQHAALIWCCMRIFETTATSKINVYLLNHTSSISSLYPSKCVHVDSKNCLSAKQFGHLTFLFRATLW